MASSGIDVSSFRAHSMRGAATSTDACAGVSTAKILKAADWSSENTFTKIYKKEVTSSKFGAAVLALVKLWSIQGESRWLGWNIISNYVKVLTWHIIGITVCEAVGETHTPSLGTSNTFFLHPPMSLPQPVTSHLATKRHASMVGSGIMAGAGLICIFMNGETFQFLYRVVETVLSGQ